MLKITLLGPFSAEIDGAPLRFETRKVAALLAYLILYPGENRRERLAALFWPDFDAVHAMANLRRALGSLIHILPPGYVLADRETICWREPEPASIDLRDFQAGLQAARAAGCLDTPEGLAEPSALAGPPALAGLAALYQADFLEDLTLPDCPEFDEWQYGFREELRREFAWVLEKAALGWSARGDWEKAAEVARRWVRLDRLDARAQLALTGIYARSGQRSLAQRTYEEYARLIQNTFDQEPEEAVKEQFRAVLSQPPQSKEAKPAPPGQRLPAAVSQGFQTLLKTKLYIPRIKPGRVHRQRLLSRLEAIPRYRLTLVSAPAGFGKTSLLAEWAASTQAAVGWISLDREDNDPGHFLHYLCAALDALFEDGMADALELLQNPQPAHPMAVVAILLNEVERTGESLVLVLDDYQFVTAEAVHELVAYLLAHAAPNLHLVIATRADPTLPLARLRAQGDLLEVRTDDLRFTETESDALFDQVNGLKLDTGDLHAIVTRTEGWAVGLQMAALALQGLALQASDDRAQFVRNFSGTHRYILDYLIQEVLVRQTARVRDFLLKTSILDRLCGELCEAVVGETAESGYQTLDYLERSNLFLVPLDEQAASGAGAGWFRYHHLFADLLASQLQQLQPHSIPELHARASAWYEKNGWFDRAIEHALAGEDYARAGQLVENSAQKLIYQIPFGTMQNWINRLPKAMVQQRVWIGITQGWIWVATGRMSSLGSWIDTIEQNFLAADGDRYPETEQQDIRANFASLRAYDAFYQGDLPRSAELSNQALQLLPRTNDDLRVRVLIQIGEAYMLLHRLERASPYFYQAIEVGTALGDFQSVTTALMRLIKTLKIRGKLNQAEEIVRSVFDALAEAGRAKSPIATKPEQCLGDLLRERGRMEEAGAQLQQALLHARQYNIPLDIMTALIYKGVWLMSQGKWDAAQNCLDEAEPLIHAFTIPPVILNTWALRRARCWLEKGALERVEQWIQESQVLGEKVPISVREEAGILQARLLIKKGKQEEALARLAELVLQAEEGQRIENVIHALLIQTCAWDALGQAAQAQEALVRCLRLTHAEGYITVFLEEGEPVYQLLKALQRTGLPQPLAGCALRLIQAFEEKKNGT